MQAGIKALADIPSREVLLGRLLGSMQSPIANFARVIKQIAEKDGEATPQRLNQSASRMRHCLIVRPYKT